MHSQKYPRTYHFPFSPGTTSDDRIAKDISGLLQKNIVITEKLDGENSCLNQYGVFARSHAAPTQNPWANYLWEKWHLLKNDLGDIEIFGESLYAIHSIEYRYLESYFYVFAIRVEQTWLSWEEVIFYANMFDFPTVPLLYEGIVQETQTLKTLILDLVTQPSQLSNEKWGFSPREGIVARNSSAFENTHFSTQVFKWVRKNHVKTNEHWTKNWQRAKLYYEYHP